MQNKILAYQLYLKNPNLIAVAIAPSKNRPINLLKKFIENEKRR